LHTGFEAEITFVSETKFAAITIDGGKGKGSASYADFDTEITSVSETKFAVITIGGGKGKGSAFSTDFSAKTRYTCKAAL
ncbi:MAG: hypothetical protein HDT24_10655, partial [Ruminococcus sp.]|nr:hypothetical protein [Ruminococcus sp.]